MNYRLENNEVKKLYEEVHKLIAANSINYSHIIANLYYQEK